MQNVVMLSVIVTNVIVLGAIMQNVVMLSVIMPNVIVLSAIMINIILLSVLLSYYCIRCRYAECHYA
jgi:hypothetical protein